MNRSEALESDVYGMFSYTTAAAAAATYNINSILFYFVNFKRGEHTVAINREREKQVWVT